jgi:hypothetical protein
MHGTSLLPMDSETISCTFKGPDTVAAIDDRPGLHSDAEPGETSYLRSLARLHEDMQQDTDSEGEEEEEELDVLWPESTQESTQGDVTRSLQWRSAAGYVREVCLLLPPGPGILFFSLIVRPLTPVYSHLAFIRPSIIRSSRTSGQKVVRPDHGLTIAKLVR